MPIGMKRFLKSAAWNMLPRALWEFSLVGGLRLPVRNAWHLN